MKQKALILLSSGLDSSVNLAMAQAEFDVVFGLTADYGQRAASNEITHAKALCDHYRVKHHTIDLSFFKDFTKTSLVNHKNKVPSGKEISIDDQTQSEKSAQGVWVPNRNGILINIAAGFAEGNDIPIVIVGFNREEAQTFPDNTASYLKELNASFASSTKNKVQVLSLTTELDKIEIAKKGQSLNLPWDKVWTCYLGEEKPCKTCESCQRFFRAIKEAEVAYPMA